MKKIICTLFLAHALIKANDDLYPKPPITSRTFMYVRPIFQNIALERPLWGRELFYLKHKFACQATGFYQKAFDTSEILKFFMPEFEEPTLEVSANPYTGNVNPHWLQLPSNFSGTLTFNPTYSSGGLRIDGRFALGSIADIPFFRHIWFGFSLPFTMNKQNINLEQSNVENPGPSTNTVYDILTAFDNPDWNFYKIAHRPAVKRLSEIRLAYGTSIYATDRAHAVTYAGLSIPTYKKPKDQYMFEPQIGFDYHLGIIWGFNLELPINRENDSYQVTLRADLENTYLLKGHRYRTFDLLNKQWSRFLLFRSQYEPADITIPGVNILSLDAMVAPHSLVDFAFGFRLLTGNIQSEFGYAMWAHGGEKVRLDKPFQEIYGIAGSSPLTSASNSTIKTVAANDASFTVVKVTDIDLQSGTMPAVWVHRIYGHCGYTMRGEPRDFFAGAGLFVEIPQQRRRSLAMYGVHVKAGFGF